MILAAGAGGAFGSALRGDDAGTIASEGATQAALQGGGMAAAKLIQGLARIPYRAAIPKNVLDKFAKSDLAGQGLQERVVLGTANGADRASAASARAGGAIQDAAESVAPMTAQDVQAAFKPKYNKALTAGKTDRAVEIGDHVHKSMNEIGSGPFTGKQQLARKEFLEQEGKSAMAAPNSNMAAVNPQLANIERRAILKNLRQSPDMADALNASQAAIGVDRAAQATKNSSVINRLAHSGVWNAARSPMGLSGLGIAMNEGRQIANPQVLRLLDLIMGAQQ